jgi:hypothetical protein
LQAIFGDRLRWIETEARVDESTAAALAAAGVRLIVVEPGPGGAIALSS